jgi:hypothetical protein
MNVDIQLVVPLCALAISALAVIRSIQVQRRNTSLAGRLAEATGNLEAIRHSYGELKDRCQSSLEFRENLSEAAVTTRLQAPRLALQSRPEAMAAPERYRYVHRLTENGMDADQVASVLSISSHEARQLVSLARLGAAHGSVSGR